MELAHERARRLREQRLRFARGAIEARRDLVARKSLDPAQEHGRLLLWRQAVERVLDPSRELLLRRPGETVFACLAIGVGVIADSVAADREWIVRALSNLLENAIKFTPDGGEVRLRAEQVGAEVRLSVEDDGRGIPAEDLPHIFDRYWRGDAAARGGAGLGLAVAKGIVEAHRGEIWVDSRPGVGSAFHFTLPLAPRVSTPGESSLTLD